MSATNTESRQIGLVIVDDLTDNQTCINLTSSFLFCNLLNAEKSHDHMIWIYGQNNMARDGERDGKTGDSNSWLRQ